jgi:transposase
MRRFVEGMDRGQITLFPECLEDWIGEDNPVRVVDVFVDELDLAGLGFSGVDPEATGRPSYHPSVLLKLYIYGYLNRVQSSRRLEREAGRNVEVMWLTGRLTPDHKTIADFRKDNGRAIRQVCARFVALCRTMGLLTEASVAIDGSPEDGEKELTNAEPPARPVTPSFQKGIEIDHHRRWMPPSPWSDMATMSVPLGTRISRRQFRCCDLDFWRDVRSTA